MHWWIKVAAGISGFLLAHRGVKEVDRRRRWAQRGEEEKRRTALHEAAHAVAAWESPVVSRVLGVTIMPMRKGLLGEVRFERPAAAHDDEQALRQLIRLRLAGFAAEKVVYGAIPDAWLLQEDAILALACLIALERGGSEESCLDIARIVMMVRSEGDSVFVHKFQALRERLLVWLAMEFTVTMLHVDARLEAIRRVADALLERRTLGAADLERLLGPRPPS